ncbi:hypothetical protein P7C73_g2417, partial [Tremellales sp. Uapishka_1]
MTKAFAPHGLLQAGIQDKEDRSAKKQEELARETGSSLINVPNKPPPPQTGLLGAVAAHERDRKNAGGIGATLTDRDRERRLVEERQRKIDELQRQQMEHMSQFGGDGTPSPYGYGMPPMMPPQMPMGYPQGWQGGMNPYLQQQAMMAAQMAYQQMMMMSQAGSQVGDFDARPISPSGSISRNGGLNPYSYPPPMMGSPWGSPALVSPMPPRSTGWDWPQQPTQQQQQQYDQGQRSRGGSDTRSQRHDSPAPAS